MNNTRLEVALLRLSLQRVDGKRQPQAPDNAARYRAFRQYLPAPTHNAHDWPHNKAARYAAQQSPMDEQAMREGFAMKYGTA